MRLPIALVSVIGAGLLFPGASQLPLITTIGAVVMLYSVALFFLLSRGRGETAFWVGLVADSLALLISWWILAQPPELGAVPTDLYLVLFPVLIVGTIRLGPVLGAVHASAWIVWMAFASWTFHGPDSYAVEQFPVRALFLLLTVWLVALVVGRASVSEGRLAASESRFRSIFESAPAGVALLDHNRRILAVNQALTAMLLAAPDELIGRRFGDFEDDDTRARRLITPFADMKDGELDKFEVQRRLLRGDDTFIWVNSITSAVRDPDGHFSHAVRILEDVTERKRTELAKDELMALTSHELKTPITAIHAALGLAAGGVLGELPPKALEMIAIAAKNSERLMALIQNILDLEGMRLGRVPLKTTACNSSALLQRTVDLLAPSAIEQNVTLSVDSAPLDVLCEEGKIIQVLTNLTTNAMKFAGANAVHLRCHGLDGQAVFTVSDQGPGISKDQQQIIFERFRHADNAGAIGAKGTGLGLAIAQAIVQGHGGRIWVESAIGEGSTFGFTLPLAPIAAS
jgi:PAS domain S-box-containing protein